MSDYFTPSAQISLTLNIGDEPCYYAFSHWLLPILASEIGGGRIGVDVSCRLVRARVLQDGSTVLESPAYTTQACFPDGSQVIHKGSLRVLINSDLRIERYDYVINTKAITVDPERHVPHPMACSAEISKYGLHHSTIRMLQIGDVMTMLKPLMEFHSTNGNDSPLRSFETFSASLGHPSRQTSQHQVGQQNMQAPMGIPSQSASSIGSMGLLSQDNGVSPRTVTPRT